MLEDADYPIAGEIVDAIERGDLTVVRKMLEEDPKRLHWVAFRGTWLHEAAFYNQVQIAEYLLAARVPLDNDPGTSRGTALNVAATQRATETVRLLLERGAKMDVSDPVLNPLFGAALKGSMDIVQLLLDHGIDATVSYTGENAKNMSVVEFADEQGQHAVRDQVRAFLAARAKGESEEAGGRTN